MERADRAPVTFLAYSTFQCVPLSMSRRFRRQAKMSSRFHQITRAAALSAVLALASQALSSKALAQSEDPEMRIQQLENQLRQLTGQNEDLLYRNRQLEERLRLLQGGAQAPPGGQPAIGQPNIATVLPCAPD